MVAGSIGRAAGLSSNDVLAGLLWIVCCHVRGRWEGGGVQASNRGGEGRGKRRSLVATGPCSPLVIHALASNASLLPVHTCRLGCPLSLPLVTLAGDAENSIPTICKRGLRVTNMSYPSHYHGRPLPGQPLAECGEGGSGTFGLAADLRHNCPGGSLPSDYMGNAACLLHIG